MQVYPTCIFQSHFQRLLGRHSRFQTAPPPADKSLDYETGCLKNTMQPSSCSSKREGLVLLRHKLKEWRLRTAHVLQDDSSLLFGQKAPLVYAHHLTLRGSLQNRPCVVDPCDVTTKLDQCCD